MGVTQYVGARYVPKFTDNPDGLWTNTVAYEPLTIVLYQGNSYTSRQSVPIGIDISNTDYWAETGNYNAQTEAYRKEVQAILPYDDTPTAGSTKGVESGGVASAISTETTARENADTTLQTNIDAVSTTLDAVVPLDTTPTANSTKGVTSGGVEAAITLETNSRKTQFAEIAPFDTTPTSGSLKGVTSGGVYSSLAGNVALIGDSYGTGYQPSEAAIKAWPDYVKDMLPNVNIYTHSKNGAAIHNTTTNVTWVETIQELMNSMTTAQRDSVKSCIIVGGYNDLWVTDSDVQTYMPNILNAVHTAFSNLQTFIYDFIGASGTAYNAISGYGVERITHYLSTVTNYAFNVGVAHGSPLLTNSDFTTSDNIHINSSGEILLAKQVAAIITNSPFIYSPTNANVSVTITNLARLSTNLLSYTVPVNLGHVRIDGISGNVTMDSWFNGATYQIPSAAQTNTTFSVVAFNGTVSGNLSCLWGRYVSGRKQCNFLVSLSAAVTPFPAGWYYTMSPMLFCYIDNNVGIGPHLAGYGAYGATAGFLTGTPDHIRLLY